MYQNARWNCPELRRFYLRIQNLPVEDRRTTTFNTIVREQG